MSSTLAPAGFSQETFDASSLVATSRAGLATYARRLGLAFANSDMPTGRDEEWMRTDIRLFKLDRFATATELPEIESPRALLAEGVELGVDSLSR